MLESVALEIRAMLGDLQPSPNNVFIASAAIASQKFPKYREHASAGKATRFPAIIIQLLTIEVLAYPYLSEIYPLIKLDRGAQVSTIEAFKTANSLEYYGNLLKKKTG